MNKTFAVMAATLLATGSVAVQAQQNRADAARSAETGVISTRADYSRSMEDLQLAAQRLRGSIQALAQEEPGPQRRHALRATREALYDAQRAMIQLPPELRQAPPGVGDAVQPSAVKAGAGQDNVRPSYAEAMAQLQRSGDRLRDAVQDMSHEPAGPRRNRAMQDATTALLDAQQAMVWQADATYASSEPGHAARGATSSKSGYGATAGGGIAAGSDASQVHGKVPAVAGGVGLDARAALSNRGAPEHNVKMVFALDTGNYLADVPVKVTDSAGRTVLDGVSDGPWLYAKLPPGDYNATAVYSGKSVTRHFSVGHDGQRVAYFRWPASVERQAGTDVRPILGTGLHVSSNR